MRSWVLGVLHAHIPHYHFLVPLSTPSCSKMAARNTAIFSKSINDAFQLGINQGTIGDIHFGVDSNFLAHLRLTDPRHDKEHIKDTKGGLFRDVSDWIFHHPDFQQWRNDDQSQLLWVKGDPGKGKTMLLITIIDGLEQELEQLKESY